MTSSKPFPERMLVRTWLKRGERGEGVRGEGRGEEEKEGDTRGRREVRHERGREANWVICTTLQK